MLAQCDGGPTGGEASIALLGLGYEDVMLLVAGHADPIAVLSAARGAGYEVAGWLARPFGFGALHPPVMNVLRGLANGPGILHRVVVCPGRSSVEARRPGW
jgi:hypothetical protein